MITINNLDFGYEKKIFEDFNLIIKPQTKVAIIGTSGCGKSTLLKLLLKINQPKSGTIKIENNSKMIGYMPQNDSLLAWYTVEENIMLPLKINKIKLSKSLVELVQEFGLNPQILTKYPRELSGGMKSRVALIRASLMANDLLILDEPLSRLDYLTHQQILSWLKQQLEQMATTMLLVTHNIEEAITLCERIIVLKDNPVQITADYDVKLWDEFKLKQQIINDLIEEEK